MLMRSIWIRRLCREQLQRPGFRPTPEWR